MWQLKGIIKSKENIVKFIYGVKYDYKYIFKEKSGKSKCVNYCALARIHTCMCGNLARILKEFFPSLRDVFTSSLFYHYLVNLLWNLTGLQCLKSSQYVLIYLTMLQIVCLKMLQNVAKCLNCFIRVSICLNISHNVTDSVSQNVANRLIVLQIICLRMLQNV